MIKLTQEEREKIKDAVKDAERKTSGEFVTVIARQSDSYFYIPALWAALLTLFVPPVMIFIFQIHQASLTYDVQVISFAVMFLILQIPGVRLLFVPKVLKKMAARKLAFEQFFRQDVSRTTKRAGILLFVSYAEKYVEIIADEGIDKLVDPGQWQSIVDDFIDLVKKDRIFDGYMTAIEKCTAILAQHFPYEKGDINELADRLIEI